MSVVQIIGYVLLILVDVVLIAAVLLQPGKDGQDAGSMLSGNVENFLGKGKARGLEAKLNKITRVLAVSFGVICVGLVIVLRFV